MLIPLNLHFIADFPWHVWIPFWVSPFWALYISYRRKLSTPLVWLLVKNKLAAFPGRQFMDGFSASPSHFRLGHSTPKPRIRSLSTNERMGQKHDYTDHSPTNLPSFRFASVLISKRTFRTFCPSGAGKAVCSAPRHDGPPPGPWAWYQDSWVLLWKHLYELLDVSWWSTWCHLPDRFLVVLC